MFGLLQSPLSKRGRKYELKQKYIRITNGELKGDLNNQDYPWWFNENTISNSWTGKYYESKEEALKSFK